MTGSALKIEINVYFGRLGDEKMRESRLGLFYFVKPFVPCLALELPCRITLDIFMVQWTIFYDVYPSEVL